MPKLGIKSNRKDVHFMQATNFAFQSRKCQKDAHKKTREIHANETLMHTRKISSSQKLPMIHS